MNLRTLNACFAVAILWTGLTASLAAAADRPLYKAKPATVVNKLFADLSVDGVISGGRPSSAVIVDDVLPGNPIFTGDDIEFRLRLGLDARVRIGYGDWSIEGRYFGIFKRDAHNTFMSTPIWSLPTNPTAFWNWHGADEVDLRQSF